MNQKERLVELIKQAKKQTKNANCDIERNMIFADYLLENGVIVPPCKVGDVVYLITDHTGDMRRTVTGFTQDYILSYAMQIPMSEFGKTVFLTREEAEKALRGGATDTNVGGKEKGGEG